MPWVRLLTRRAVFTKLASQLTADTLSDLAIIPFIFFAQMLISYCCAFVLSKIFRFQKRPRDFVTAMAVCFALAIVLFWLIQFQVFGNSNSLPISLVISLSKTISGLHWDAIPGDNDDEVASRGILYLLIFQQLGQLVRWTWGYNVLLAPQEAYDDERVSPERVEEGMYGQTNNAEALDTQPEERQLSYPCDAEESSPGGSGDRTPLNAQTRTTSMTSKASSVEGGSRSRSPKKRAQNSEPRPDDGASENDADEADPLIPLPEAAQRKVTYLRRQWQTLTTRTAKVSKSATSKSSAFFIRIFRKLPEPTQRVLHRTGRYVGRFAHGVWEFMNPPLWAMLAAILVASVPRLQTMFFTRGTFINNTFTRGVQQSGGVAVPLILVVLGANLARNTLPRAAESEEADPKIENRLLFASIVSRMLLPTVFVAPLLALCAKYLNISILDDPIFVIVCFLLTGAPSALQLAQICQINNVYVGAMSRLLFQSYVVWYVTHVHLCALEVLICWLGFFHQRLSWSCLRSKWSSGPILERQMERIRVVALL